MCEKHISGRGRHGSRAGESSVSTAIRAPSARCQALSALAAGLPRGAFRAPCCPPILRSERSRSHPATLRRNACGDESSTSSLRTLLFAHHKADGPRHLAPTAGFAHQLLSAIRRQPVELCLAIVLACAPVRRNPLTILKAVKCQ